MRGVFGLTSASTNLNRESSLIGGIQCSLHQRKRGLSRLYLSQHGQDDTSYNNIDKRCHTALRSPPVKRREILSLKYLVKKYVLFKLPFRFALLFNFVVQILVTFSIPLSTLLENITFLTKFI